MKLAISNIAWEEANDNIVYEYMKEYGFTGVEIAPTRWIQEAPYDKIEQAKIISDSLMETYGFVVPSMQSVWFGRGERIFCSQEERSILMDYTKKAIDYAVAIGCKNLVFGCPRNRKIEAEWNLSKEQIETIEKAFFQELGDYAYIRGTAIGMEANPTIYNTNYINTTESALDLIKKADSKGFLLNLDIGTMIQNEEEIDLLKGKVSLINHVHISEPGLKAIQKRTLHQKLAYILKEEGYEKYISIEMGKQEEVTSLKEVMQYVAEVYHD